ncbi:ABC transporter ATP-binding protein [Paracoccus sp. CPCC 101403]|uniref:ABC transporter ATP-binding protein n=1 Tax=Paracoccus broussonetiae TaxID=3075834 RepID=A0ABU3EH59_9RHOB|nr:ABC transporter ATP-binding protein [Paracoccus sp. CPCC 101403]MDT1063586.1 ABC transporter ATP-binding protein [Paracoccus sp. CPCC 101403]
MTGLVLSGLSCRHGRRVVIDGIDLALQPGEFVGLIGPNGAGKTTLLRAAQGLLPFAGQSSLAALPPRERARAAAFMPQGREIAWPVSVEALVSLGRIAHPDAAAEVDRLATDRAIAALGLDRLRHRSATTLSGGEQARALLARALAQETPLLIADEPISGLDPAAQIEVMQMFRQLASQGRTVLASLHDLGLAARHCTRLVLLHRSRIAADGPPRAVLTTRNLADCFGVAAHVEEAPQGLIVQLLGRAARDT